MVSVKTIDIEVAIQALRGGDCIKLDGSNAGWGDAELFRIIQCLNEGCGMNLVELILGGNRFSQGGMRLLCAVIGPTAGPAMASAAAAAVVNPQ